MTKKQPQPETTNPTIEVENVGPVARVTIPVPVDGGLVVLRGRNGSGKTTTLDAIQTVATGKGKLDVRDGELRGEVRAFGATVTVAQSTRRRGEVDVVTLEGRGDVSTLVDPGLKSDDAADVHRIRSLLALTNCKVDASLFWPLLDGRESFEAVVSARAVEGDDPVQIADRVKRDIEAKARTVEAEVEHAQQRASSLLALNEGLDLEVEHDAEKLAEAYADARAAVERRRAEVDRYNGEVEARAEAERALAEFDASAERSLSIPNLVDAEGLARTALAEKKREHAEVEVEVERLQAALNSARNRATAVAGEVDVCVAKLDAAVANVNAAKQREKERERLEKAASAVLPASSPTLQLELANVEANDARARMEHGVKVREGIKRKADADACLERAGDLRRRAEALRNAARSVDVVLSELVGRANRKLRVEAGRLILDTARGKTYFADLSHGERWKIALDVAIEAVGRGGVLVCPQEAFEGLDPSNRRAIADHLRGTGVVMFTAEATDSPEIEVAVLDPSPGPSTPARAVS